MGTNSGQLRSELVFFFMAISADLESWNIHRIKWWPKRCAKRTLPVKLAKVGRFQALEGDMGSNLDSLVY